jgi:hypothetical protein
MEERQLCFDRLVVNTKDGSDDDDILSESFDSISWQRSESGSICQWSDSNDFDDLICGVTLEDGQTIDRNEMPTVDVEPEPSKTFIKTHQTTDLSSANS